MIATDMLTMTQASGWPVAVAVVVLASIVGCQDPEDGFIEAKDFDNLDAWRDFVDRHGEDHKHPKVLEGRQILADRLLEVCTEAGDGQGAREAPTGCLAPIWAELPETRSGERAATLQGQRALQACDVAADRASCLEGVVRLFDGFDVGQVAAEEAAKGQVSRCNEGDPTAQCYRAVAIAWEGTQAGAGATTAAQLLEAPAEEQAAWLADNPLTAAAAVLRGRLCVGRSVLVFDEANREKLARDGVAALVRIRQAGGAGSQGQPVAPADRGSPLVERLKAAGCAVVHWTEPDVTVNIATGRKEVDSGDANGGAAGAVAVARKYKPEHKLKKKDRAKHDIVVRARRVASQRLKYSFNDPLKIAFKRTTEITRRRKKKGGVVSHSWTFMQSQGLSEPVKDQLAKQAAEALKDLDLRHSSALLALLDTALTEAAREDSDRAAAEPADEAPEPVAPD